MKKGVFGKFFIKKGLSPIVTSLVIIISSLIVIGVAVFVFNPFDSSEMGLKSSQSNFNINNVYVDNESISVEVVRNFGDGELSKIKFILSDGENSETIEKSSDLNLGIEEFILTPSKLIVSKIKTISIIPVFSDIPNTESAYDTYQVKSYCVSRSNEVICNNSVCGTKINNCGDEVYCGHCVGNQTCILGQCISNCTPATCSDFGYNCGKWDDGCGGNLSCGIYGNGSCAGGKICNSTGVCVTNQPTCSNDCASAGLKQCSMNGYRICGNYDADSCFEWSNVANCQEGWTCRDNGICKLDLGSKLITIGQDYNYVQDQATVEFIDLTNYRQKDFTITTNTNGYIISELLLYDGEIDLTKHWGDSQPLYAIDSKKINPTLTIPVPPSADFYSVVYIVRYEYGTPKDLQITRNFLISEPKSPTDWSRTFVTLTSTFPDSILNNLNSQALSNFNENMNRAYTSFKDLTGEDSDVLDASGKLKLIIEDTDYCGLAGNPIRMDPVCMDADLLNSYNPGWGAVHELGHDFTCSYSYCWGDTNEAWANFMAFYAYDEGLFINSNFDKSFWDNVWDASPKKADILQGLIVHESYQHGWQVAKNFFRKYIVSDPAKTQDDTEKQKLAVKYLAESVREVTGQQTDYDSIVNHLVSNGFPSP